jgi:hypothetical protein
MHEPDYTDYSLDQLYDCLDHINSEKYPLRFEQLQQEIALRSEAGEICSDPVLNELTAIDVPVTLGFRALYCFSWRFSIAAGLFVIVIFGASRLNDFLHLLPPSMLLTCEIIFAVVFFSIAGTIIMMQVLSKRYPGYRIRIVRLHQSKSPLHDRSIQ